MLKMPSLGSEKHIEVIGTAMNRRRSPSSWAYTALILLIALGVFDANGEWSLIEEEDTSLSIGLEAGIGLFGTDGVNFGTGTEDLVTGEFTQDPAWQEGYLKPYIAAEKTSTSHGSFYAGASAVIAGTAGDGDAGGYTNSDDGLTSIESLFAGWRSGDLLATSLGQDALEISYGRQEFQVGDGFLIWDGNLDQFDKGAYWLAPRNAFRSAALFKFTTQAVHADLFHLTSDHDHDNTELAGLSLEYKDEDYGTLAMMYFNVLDADQPYVWGPREGMDVWSLRATEVGIPSAPDLRFWGQYVSESGNGRDARFDAEAWFVEAQYTFSALPWTPTLSYRYAHFSGDPDPDDDKRQDFDPFFYGWSRGWGTWYQGEITGEYLLFNSNQNNHMLHLAAYPSDELGIGLILYRFDLDQPDYYGTPVSDTHFADELNLYVDWTLSDSVSLSAAYALVWPGTAAKEAFGGDKRFQLLELAVYLSF